MGKLIKLELFKGAGGAITQNSYINSQIIELDSKEFAGSAPKAILYMKNTGGTVTVTVTCCPTYNGTYSAPDTGIALLTTAAAGTHISANTDLPNMPFIKLLFTETNVAAVTAMDAWLFIR